MAGTLRGALAARVIRLNQDTFKAEVEGLIEKVGSGIRITMIRIHYRLTIPKDKRTEAERALAVHDKGCPVTQNVTPVIAVEWDSDYAEV
jgi:uncharacterized OsmC-like protein